jgi:lipoprotein LprG
VAGESRRLARVLAAFATPTIFTVLLAACGAPADAGALLRQAKASIDSTRTLHFHLSSSNVQGSGPLITGGEGDAQRPAGFAGTLDVGVAGLAVGLQVVSVDGTFYVKLPTASAFSVADPSKYGFGDPGKLLDPASGLSSLLLQCRAASVAGTDRYNGEELDEVSCRLPGTRVASLLASADPSQAVSATFGIDPDNHQVRRVVLTGPFFSKTAKSTFTVVLDDYGENVTVTPPAVE